MKKGEKAFVIVIISTIVIIIVQLILGQSMLAHFEVIEKRQMVEDLRAIENCIECDIRELDSIVKDWAYCDNTYNFMKTKNSTYIQSNLIGSVFENLKVNLIIFIDNNGEIFWGTAYNLTTKEMTPLPQSLNVHIQPNSNIFKSCLEKNGLRGIVILERATLFSMYPILTSEGKGPSTGFLLMGRYLDFQLNDIKAMLGKNFSVYILGVELERVEGELFYEGIYIKPLNENIIGYRVLKDVYGKDALVIELAESRWIYREGVVHVFYFAFATLSCTTLIGVGIFLIFKHGILGDIERVDKELERIGESGDITARVSVKGDDEISNMCKIINGMLDKLEKAQAKLQEERVSAIGETAKIIAHDLRNPLQSIVNNVYLIEEKVRSYKTLQPDLLEKLDSIKLQINYMDKIVSDLYYYGETLQISKKEIDLCNFIRDTLSYTPVPPNVKTEIFCEEGLKVVSDPIILRRVLANIILNAVQAMPEGGKLIIGGVREGEEVVLTVTDTGRGIPRELQEKVFEPLFTTKSKGMGLGLAVCKRLIEFLGGKITFYSMEGVGTTFTITLPLSNVK
ncbi:MAG: CHASE4 domain-containing protein [Nitrososphaeria archaeon]